MVTIQIRGTIQNTCYYSNSEYEQCTSTHPGVARAPKLFTIQALFEALILDGGYVRDYLCVKLVNMQIWWVDVCVWFSGSFAGWRDQRFSRSCDYAYVCPTRYSPHASLARFRTRLTSTSPSLSPAMHTQDSGSIVSPDGSTRREHFSAHTEFFINIATRANTRITHVEISPLGSLA